MVLLNRQNKLGYDDDIRKYIPELNFYPKITIGNLIHHTSGLPDYMHLADSIIIQNNKKALFNNQTVIDLYKKSKPKLNFLPNTKFEYNNTGYLLLATIIERLSKQSFSQYLKTHIFSPLQINDTKVLFRYIKSAVDNLKNTD